MKIFLYLILIPIICISTFSCDQTTTEEKPANLIPEEDYVQLLVELQLIRAVHNTRLITQNMDSLKNLVFEKYEISEDQFIESNRFYQKQVEGQIRRANKAIELLEIETQKFEADSVEVVND